MSFACRWINVHLIVYNIFSAFLLNDTIERFNKIFAAPKHSSTTLHQCTTFSFWFLIFAWLRLRWSPLVCYKCYRMYSQMMVVMIVTMMDLFSFNDRVPVQETLANTKPLVEAVISTLDVTACVPLDLAVKLVKKVNFVFATILEDIQWWAFWQGGVKEFFSQMWNVIDTILRLCCTYVTNKRYTK